MFHDLPMVRCCCSQINLIAVPRSHALSLTHPRTETHRPHPGVIPADQAHRCRVCDVRAHAVSPQPDNPAHVCGRSAIRAPWCSPNRSRLAEPGTVFHKHANTYLYRQPQNNGGRAVLFCPIPLLLSGPGDLCGSRDRIESQSASPTSSTISCPSESVGRSF